MLHLSSGLPVATAPVCNWNDLSGALVWACVLMARQRKNIASWQSQENIVVNSGT